MLDAASRNLALLSYLRTDLSRLQLKESNGTDMIATSLPREAIVCTYIVLGLIVQQRTANTLQANNADQLDYMSFEPKDTKRLDLQRFA